MAAPLISQGEVEWITAGVSYNTRNDGRKREDFRHLKVQLGMLAQATGSARVQLGETDVIVGVKVRFPCRS
jgi:exosome complex component RRP42